MSSPSLAPETDLKGPLLREFRSSGAGWAGASQQKPRSTSTLGVGMGLLLLAALFDDPLQFHRRDLGVELAVDVHHRSQAARAHAGHDFKAEQLVPGGLSGLDLQGLSDHVQGPSRALDMTGGATAHHHVVLPLGLETEHVEKGRDTKDLAGRHFKRLPHLGDGFLRQVPFGLLDLLEDRDQVIPASVRMFHQDSLNALNSRHAVSPLTKWRGSEEWEVLLRGYLSGSAMDRSTSRRIETWDPLPPGWTRVDE